MPSERKVVSKVEKPAETEARLFENAGLLVTNRGWEFSLLLSKEFLQLGTIGGRQYGQ